MTDDVTARHTRSGRVTTAIPMGNHRRGLAPRLNEIVCLMVKAIDIIIIVLLLLLLLLFVVVGILASLLFRRASELQNRNEISPRAVVNEEILDNGAVANSIILYQDFLYSMAAWQDRGKHKYLKRSRVR